jgi:hypothetical protein
MTRPSDAFDREQELDEIRARLRERQKGVPNSVVDTGSQAVYDPPRIPIPREPGPQAIASIVWTFQLGARDASLMLRALGGRLADDEDRAAASTLCDRLTLQRERQIFDALKGYTIAAEHVRAKDQP